MKAICWKEESRSIIRRICSFRKRIIFETDLREEKMINTRG